MELFSVSSRDVKLLTPSDSTPAVEATWRAFSESRGLDLDEVLQSKPSDMKGKATHA
jgi:hypothetical protein